MKSLLFSRLSIRGKLILGVAVVHTVLMSFFVVDLVERQRQFIQQERWERSTTLMKGVSDHIAKDLMTGDLAALQESIDGLVRLPDMDYAMVVDTHGKVLAHSEVGRAGKYLVDAQSQAFLKATPALQVLESSGDWIELVAPVKRGDNLLGWVRIRTGLQSMQAVLRAVTTDGVIYALMAVTVGIGLAYGVSRGILRQLYELLTVANATRKGQRELRAPQQENNEIGQLATAFNEMLNALEKQERALARSNRELELRVAERTEQLQQSEAAQRAILEQANDAFISMDDRGKVLAWNRQAELLFGWSREEAHGRAVAELIVPEELRASHWRELQEFQKMSGGSLINRHTEMIVRTREGRRLPVELSVGVRKQDERMIFDAFLRDISERKAIEKALAEKAFLDALTGLPNRRAVVDRIPRAIKRANRHQEMALLFLDLDGFKAINDEYGHDAGDEVLRQTAVRIRQQIRDDDTAGRLGGDEFVVILEGLSGGQQAAERVAGKIIEVIRQPIALPKCIAQLSTSIGIALWRPGCSVEAEVLLARADQAMYLAKRDGKGVFRTI